MKRIFLSFTFIVTLHTLLLSQGNNNGYLFIGASIEPAFSVQRVRNLEDYSTLPNLNISYGNKKLNAYLSVGVVSKLGFLSIHKWTYASASYTVNSMTMGFVEHGPEISTGFNFIFGKDKRFRFFSGSSISMVIYAPIALKVVLRPVVVGLSFNLLN